MCWLNGSPQNHRSSRGWSLDSNPHLLSIDFTLCHFIRSGIVQAFEEWGTPARPQVSGLTVCFVLLIAERRFD